MALTPEQINQLVADSEEAVKDHLVNAFIPAPEPPEEPPSAEEIYAEIGAAVGAGLRLAVEALNDELPDD